MCPRQGPAQSSAPAGAPHQEEGKGGRWATRGRGGRKGERKGHQAGESAAPGHLRLLCWPDWEGTLCVGHRHQWGRSLLPVTTELSLILCLRKWRWPFKMFPSQTDQSYTEDAGHTGWGGGSFLPSAGKQPSLVSMSTVPPVVLQCTASPQVCWRSSRDLPAAREPLRSLGSARPLTSAPLQSPQGSRSRSS